MFSFFKRHISIASWEAKYLEHAVVRMQKSSICRYTLAFSRLRQAFPAAKPVNVITKAGALAMLDRIAQARGGGPANDCRKCLSCAWKWGVEYLDMPEESPFRSSPVFPQDERPRYVPPIEDFRGVLSSVSGKDYAMLLTLLHTAARRGEIFRLAWSDVDFEHGTIRLGTRKRAGGGMQFDVIPMTAKLSEVLREHRKTCPGTLVFPRPDGGRYLSRGNFFRDLCARVGVKRFGFHGVRHLSASVMARKGMAVPGIQAILRHRTPLTTARYLHRLGVLKQDLDRVFSGYE